MSFARPRQLHNGLRAEPGPRRAAHTLRASERAREQWPQLPEPCAALRRRRRSRGSKAGTPASPSSVALIRTACANEFHQVTVARLPTGLRGIGLSFQFFF